MSHAPEPPADDLQAIAHPSGEPTAETSITVGPQGAIAPNVGPQGERAPKLVPADEEPAPIAERVYAPASERVAIPPAPGYADLVTQVDPTTPERQSAGPTPFEQRAVDRWVAETPMRYDEPDRPWGRLVWWAGAWVASVVVAVLVLRWLEARRQAHNRPTARLRRGARQAVGTLAPARQAAADRLQPAQRRVRALVG